MELFPFKKAWNPTSLLLVKTKRLLHSSFYGIWGLLTVYIMLLEGIAIFNKCFVVISLVLFFLLKFKSLWTFLLLPLFRLVSKNNHFSWSCHSCSSPISQSFNISYPVSAFFNRIQHIHCISVYEEFAKSALSFVSFLLSLLGHLSKLSLPPTVSKGALCMLLENCHF